MTWHCREHVGQLACTRGDTLNHHPTSCLPSNYYFILTSFFLFLFNLLLMPYSIMIIIIIAIMIITIMIITMVFGLSELHLTILTFSLLVVASRPFGCWSLGEESERHLGGPGWDIIGSHPCFSFLLDNETTI